MNTGPTKTGRPRKALAELRSERLSGIRLTPSELAAVEAKAAQAGRPVAEFCRRAILGQPVTVRRGAAEVDRFLIELNRVGVNLNQIARAMNAGRPLPVSLTAALDEVRALLAKVADDGS